MTNFATLVIIAAIGGVAVTLQGQFMGLMDQGIGTRESVFITYASGGILACLAILATRGGNLRAWQQVPWYALGAGVLGLLIVGTIHSAPAGPVHCFYHHRGLPVYCRRTAGSLWFAGSGGASSRVISIAGCRCSYNRRLADHKIGKGAQADLPPRQPIWRWLTMMSPISDASR
jgi:hypothetical protein